MQKSCEPDDYEYEPTHMMTCSAKAKQHTPTDRDGAGDSLDLTSMSVGFHELETAPARISLTAQSNCWMRRGIHRPAATFRNQAQHSPVRP